MSLVLILGSLSALGALSIDMYLPAMPSMSRQLHASGPVIQLTLTVFVIGLAAGQVVAGPLSDMWGRRRPLLAGMALYVAGSAWCALAPSAGQLIGARAVQSLGAAAGAVLARAIVRDLFDGTAMTRFFSTLMLVNGVAPVAAPVIGGQLLTVAPWRAVFAVTGAVGITWAIVWYLVYRDPKDFHGVNQAEIDRIAARGGIPDLSERIGEQRKSFAWEDWKAVLGQRRLWGIYLGQFGLNAMQYFFLTWFPTYMVTYRHINFAKSGWLEALPFLGAFVGVLLGGSVSDGMLRRGISLTVARKVPIILGMLLSSSIVMANYVKDPLAISACLTLAFFGTGFGSITWSLVSAMAPEHLIGLTSGVFNFIGNLAAVVVPLTVGYLIKGEDFTRPLVAVAAMSLAGVASYIFLVGKVERLSVKQ